MHTYTRSQWSHDLSSDAIRRLLEGNLEGNSDRSDQYGISTRHRVPILSSWYISSKTQENPRIRPAYGAMVVAGAGA